MLLGGMGDEYGIAGLNNGSGNLGAGKMENSILNYFPSSTESHSIIREVEPRDSSPPKAMEN